jgi:hypothetical protein
MANAAPPMAELASWSERVSPIAGRPRGDVHAHERLERGAQVLAERRPRDLRGAQVGLGQQRYVLERPRAGEALAIEGRAALQVGELCSQRRGVGHGRTLADAATTGREGGGAAHNARRAARWAARCRDASEESAASAGGEVRSLRGSCVYL